MCTWVEQARRNRKTVNMFMNIVHQVEKKARAEIALEASFNKFSIEFSITGLKDLVLQSSSCWRDEGSRPGLPQMRWLRKASNENDGDCCIWCWTIYKPEVRENLAQRVVIVSTRAAMFSMLLHKPNQMQVFLLGVRGHKRMRPTPRAALRAPRRKRKDISCRCARPLQVSPALT